MVNYRLGALIGSGCDTLTGINTVQNEKPGVKIYPNPASNRITVSLMHYHRDARLYIYDAIGREVYHNESMYLDADIDVSGLASGIYLVKILSPDGDASAKFVKE